MFPRVLHRTLYALYALYVYSMVSFFDTQFKSILIHHSNKCSIKVLKKQVDMNMIKAVIDYMHMQNGVSDKKERRIIDRERVQLLRDEILLLKEQLN